MDKLNSIYSMNRKMPFSTPAGFFQKSKVNILSSLSSPKSFINRYRLWGYGIAAAIALLCVLYPLFNSTFGLEQDDSPVYGLSDSDSDDWSAFADADIFMENYN